MKIAPGPFSNVDAKPARMFVGVELGGTKCIATLANEAGQVFEQFRTPTTVPSETLAVLAGHVDHWCQHHDICALGIASFGPLELNCNSPRYGEVTDTTKVGWSGARIRSEIAGRWDLPIAFDTDVNGAAAAEMRWGVGKGLTDFAYVTVGTGVGVGLIVNGNPTRGLGHCEMGHIRVPRLAGDLAHSVCSFHDDCVEGLASGPAVEAALGGKSFEGISATDPVWDGVAHAIACLCHALVCTSGPQRIAIGGGVTAHQPHLLSRIEPMLRSSLNGYLTIPNNQSYIVAPALGDQAGALGPIALACGLFSSSPALSEQIHGHGSGAENG
jgi:fructokinase